ncbi:hypothetical protein CLAIMM_00566 [Cladophialophora immunda]|nr:hypothetical protein CLAIMM_00566 [Cladophialophora immunda]
MAVHGSDGEQDARTRDGPFHGCRPADPALDSPLTSWLCSKASPLAEALEDPEDSRKEGKQRRRISANLSSYHSTIRLIFAEIEFPRSKSSPFSTFLSEVVMEGGERGWIGDGRIRHWCSVGRK